MGMTVMSPDKIRRRFPRRAAVCLTALTIFAFLFAMPRAARADDTLPEINLTHLDALRATVKTPSHGMVAAWWVYAVSAKGDASAEPYRLVEATNEGVSCVDDVARAALVYLKHWELARDAASLEHARECFAFLRAMRAPDGTFYNWLQADGTPNTTRDNSQPGLTYWTARAVWALRKGCRTLKATRPQTASALAGELAPVLRTLRDTTTPRYRTFKTVRGQRVPLWLISDGSDSTAVCLLGLCAYERAYPSAENRELIRMLAEGIAAMQGGDADHYPWFGFRAWGLEPDRLHGWGSHQMAALVAAAPLVHDPSLIAAAQRCADNFVVAQWASDGPIYADNPAPVRYEQIAYAVEPMVAGLLALADATGKPQYRDLAVFAAGWLFGNNLADAAMYDPATGRGYDALKAGSKGEGVVNYNSGAESTIESLYTLLLCREHRIPLTALHLTRQGGQSYTTDDVTQPALQWSIAESAAGSAADAHRQTIVVKSWSATPTKIPQTLLPPSSRPKSAGVRVFTDEGVVVAISPDEPRPSIPARGYALIAR